MSWWWLLLFMAPPGLSEPVEDSRATARHGESGGVIAAYVPDYRLRDFRLADAAELTDVLFFSVRPDGDGRVQDPGGLLRRLELELPLKRSFRALLVLGGGTRSAAFPVVAVDPVKRARLVSDVTALVAQHHLDGLDVDWEHLGGVKDHAALAQLLGDLHASLGPRGLALTVAVDDATVLTAEALAAVERVHLMAYDGPRHGTLAQAKERIERALRHGVPPAKLCLGIPLYAKSRGAERPWRDVARTLKPAPDRDELDGWRFSGVETTRAKARWAREQGLGGVFFWELTQDAVGASSLVRAAREELRPPSFSGTR